ncbi:hypothetical protein [Mucilaginibacter psychrotolerans]|uniref:Uncharacterized protein n=1 Tax=Mucilaginibacter psychrotolerans TaxID=1524096 RepID=A0A4Y8S5Y0_9SPHI|nr:hypothetical protein [Mucilaginibacter psychrotolerans]TFF34403.1 hypothetical protein E2R66_22270 [Mucilaginibacter psychrotolerans]
MTNQQLKNQILTDFYQTGRIDGYYFGKKSTSKLNPIREFIKNCLYKTFMLQSVGVQDNDFISDCYQTAFLELAAMDAEKFIEIYNKSAIKGSRLIGCTLRIIVLKCFSKDRRNNNPNHSLVSKLGFGSVFNAGNYQILPMEVNDEDSDEPSLILFDEETESDFEREYGFTPEELIGLLSPEAKFTFYKQLEKQKPGAPSKERKSEKQELSEAIRGIKENLQKLKGFTND